MNTGTPAALGVLASLTCRVMGADTASPTRSGGITT